MISEIEINALVLDENIETCKIRFLAIESLIEMVHSGKAGLHYITSCHKERSPGSTTYGFFYSSSFCVLFWPSEARLGV